MQTCMHEEKLTFLQLISVSFPIRVLRPLFVQVLGAISVGSPPFYHSKFRPCTVHTQAIQTHENKSRDELDTLCIKSCR